MRLLKRFESGSIAFPTSVPPPDWLLRLMK
jgi:hypothetical protein